MRPASEVATLIDSSVPAVKSALQRARATLQEHQVNRVPAPTPPAADQRRLLQAFIAAHEQADPEALIALLRDDVRLAISPQVGEFIGRAQVAAALRAGMTSRGAWRVLPTAANGRLAAAGYLRHPGEDRVPALRDLRARHPGRAARRLRSSRLDRGLRAARIPLTTRSRHAHGEKIAEQTLSGRRASRSLYEPGPPGCIGTLDGGNPGPYQPANATGRSIAAQAPIPPGGNCRWCRVASAPTVTDGPGYRRPRRARRQGLRLRSPLRRRPSPRQRVHMAGSDRDGDREKALAAALVQIERQFGKGSVMRLGDEVRAPVETIPTGSIALDVALGIGGLPRGRVVEIYGPEGGGKTTIALHAIANAQKLGGIAAFIDAEHALDPDYAQKLGVDTDALLVSQPDTGEQALEIADMLIRSGAIVIVVIDSVAALVPRAEIEGEMGDSHVGLQARLMSQALRKLTGAISQTKTTVIFINQLREKIGVMFGCMSYTTRVTLADGSQEKIGKIVNQRMPVKVLSYDPETGTAVPRRVISWFNNGRAEKFLQFTVAKSGGNGRAQFAATGNHLIRTPGGWRPAGELIPGDRVIVAELSAQPEFVGAGLRPVPAKVIGIHVKPRTRSMNRFDIEVEGLHSYFVDGVMVHNSPETTSGGRALKFYASVRLDVRRIETLKDGTEAVGTRIRVKVVKNKVAPPFRTAEMDLLFGHGISREGGLIDLGVEQGIVRKSGAWYTCDGDQLGQGKENARTFLRDNPDLASGIEKKIKEKLGVAPRLDAEDDAPSGTADDGAGQPGGDK